VEQQQKSRLAEMGRMPLDSSVYTRQRDVDIARAFAMSLVLLHHLLQYFAGYGFQLVTQGTYSLIIDFITWIHIPTFILLSGYCHAAGDMRRHSAETYDGLAGRKFQRLVLPYVSICLIQLGVKLAFHMVHLSELPNALALALFVPHAGPAPHGWFLYMLMWIFLIWPLLRVRGGMDQRRLLVFLLGLLLVATLPIAWPRYMSVNKYYYGELQRLVWYLPMFVLGYWLGLRQRLFRTTSCTGPALQRRDEIVMGAAAIVFAGAFILRHNLQMEDPLVISRPCPEAPLLSLLLNIVRWGGSICAVVFVVRLSACLSRWSVPVGGVLSRLGFYSYDIYLLHVVCAHVLVNLLMRLPLNMSLARLAFLPVFSATLAMALAIGLLIRRIPSLSFVVLGLPYRGARADSVGRASSPRLDVPQSPEGA
jgi:surface polysaccharide O-acyltransferase-like enzyme